MTPNSQITDAHVVVDQYSRIGLVCGPLTSRPEPRRVRVAPAASPKKIGSRREWKRLRDRIAANSGAIITEGFFRAGADDAIKAMPRSGEIVSTDK